MRGHSQSDLILPENDMERRVIHALIERAIDREWPVAERTGEAEERCVIAIQVDEPDDLGWFPALAGLKFPDGGWSTEFAPLRGKVGLHHDGRTVVYHFPAAKDYPALNHVSHGHPDLDKRQFPLDPDPAFEAIP